MQKKNISVIPYDETWPEIFDFEKQQLIAALQENYISVHHVGSTAVPGLDAKPKIDIIAEVHDPERTIKQLKPLKYEYRGEYNIPLHWGFAKRGPIDFNLHVYHQGNPEITLNLTIRDWLRSHPEDRKAYAHIKYQILDDPKNLKIDNPFFARYTLEKGTFIKKILDKAGFNQTRVVFCADDYEWSQYHRIKKEQIFDPLGIVYNTKHPSITDPNHFHFVLYQGTTIIAAAHVAFLDEHDAILRAIGVDTNIQQKGHGSYLFACIQQWLQSKEKKRLFVHARKSALPFYEKHTFVPTDDFKKICIDPSAIAMEKKL